MLLIGCPCALAAADVGIATGGSTSVALETAGAAVLHGPVSDVAATTLFQCHHIKGYRLTGLLTVSMVFA